MITMTKQQGIARFRAAQDRKWSGIAQEISRGQKQTHWMWFVFPQLRVFAKSETAHHFGLADKDEALAFLADDVLRVRLATATMGVLKQRRLMFDPIDKRKLHRCMTLFSELVTDRTLPDAVITKWFDGVPHQLTLDVLAGKDVKPAWVPGQKPLPMKLPATWRPMGWSAQGSVSRRPGHWEEQVAKTRAVVQQPGWDGEEPMSHRQIESFLKGLGLTHRQVDKVVDCWLEDQNRAEQRGWVARDEED